MTGDPRRLVAKFGNCPKCGTPLKGKPAIYWPRLRQAFCEPCGEVDYLEALALCHEEDTGAAY